MSLSYYPFPSSLYCIPSSLRPPTFKPSPYPLLLFPFAHDVTSQLMLAVAAHSPQNSEVQVILGILYNISQDFDNAIECFRRAIELSPADYALFNKVLLSIFAAP